MVFVKTAAAETHVVRVANGNVDDLIVALDQASSRPPSDDTIIVINGTYLISTDQPLPAVERRVTIRGGHSSATLEPAQVDGGLRIDIQEGASLSLQNVEISGFQPGPLLSNRGELSLNRVQFSDNKTEIFCFRFGCSNTGSLIFNEAGGVVRMDRVSIIDSCTINDSSNWYRDDGCVLNNRGDAEITNSQIYFSGSFYEVPFRNGGSLRLSNLSVYSRNWHADRPLISTDSGHAEITNSVIAGYNADWCQNTVSLGNNLVESPACVFDSENDLTGTQADLIWIPVEGQWNPGGQEILTHALVPQASSFAVDSASAEACASGSLLSAQRINLDGDGDGIVGCDRGAVERIPSTLDKGGINGLYFNPDSDGHYVYIADTTHNTMVMWTTFDDRGDQAWIFGIGPHVGPTGSFHADAYINVNGKVRLDGTLIPAESVPWGTLEVRMDSCQRGRLIFDSDLPGFGSGQFAFHRLAIVDQTGCVEIR